jgi:hypothetical protein
MRYPELLVSITLGFVFGIWMLVGFSLPVRLSIVLGCAFGGLMVWIERGLLGGDYIHCIYDFNATRVKRPLRDVKYFNVEDDEAEAKFWKRFNTSDPWDLFDTAESLAGYREKKLLVERIGV